MRGNISILDAGVDWLHQDTFSILANIVTMG